MNQSEKNKLAEQIERHLIVEALEADVGLVSHRKMVAILDRSLDAWRRWSSSKSFIYKLLRIKSNSKYRAPSAAGKVDPNDFDEDYLIWFDGLIFSLNPELKSVVRYEVFHRNNRNRADEWAEEWGKSQRTYYNRLRDAREMLITAMINRF